MNKIIKSVATPLIAAAILVTSTTACSKTEEINGIDPSAPVAYIENPPDDKKDFFTVKYSDFYSEYSFFMARGGYSEENDPELASAQRDNVIRYLVQEKIALYLAQQVGITEEAFTDEDKNRVDETVKENIDSWCESYRADAISELGETYTEEELYNKELEMFSSFLAEFGLTVDIFRTWEVNGLIREKYTSAIYDDLSPETVAAFVQNTVDQAKDMYENDLATFEQSYTAFYVPEGSRRVQQILVKIDENAASEVAAYRNDGDNQKADEVLNAALEKIKYRIDEAYSRLEKGESWETVQLEYNDESDTNGVNYTLYPKSTTVNAEVIDAAMNIADVGDYSEIHKSDSGYFIIYYAGDAQFSEERIDDLHQQAREYLANEETYNKIMSFMEKYPYTYDYELLGLEEGSLELSESSEDSQVQQTSEAD